jgi:hypothetical protein
MRLATVKALLGLGLVGGCAQITGADWGSYEGGPPGEHEHRWHGRWGAVGGTGDLARYSSEANCLASCAARPPIDRCVVPRRRLETY